MSYQKDKPGNARFAVVRIVPLGQQCWARGAGPALPTTFDGQARTPAKEAGGAMPRYQD